MLLPCFDLLLVLQPCPEEEDEEGWEVEREARLSEIGGRGMGGAARYLAGMPEDGLGEPFFLRTMAG